MYARTECAHYTTHVHMLFQLQFQIQYQALHVAVFLICRIHGAFGGSFALITKLKSLSDFL